MKRREHSYIQEVSVAELFEAMKNHKAILIDVREPDEFQAAAIDRAVNYPRGVLQMRIHQHPLASPIIAILCRHLNIYKISQSI